MSMSRTGRASKFAHVGKRGYELVPDGGMAAASRESRMTPLARPTIRPIAPADEAQWRRLWAGYLEFYRQILDPATTDATWRRVLHPGREAMIGRVAEADGRLIGLLHAVVHANTWAAAPVCYLEDLFVDPTARRAGIGRALIEALAAEGRPAGWRRIYWRTAADNATAQALYDRLARRSGWVTYELDLIDANAPARGGVRSPG
jgi:GNAT superfamily N-acetyltransferase